MTHSIIYQDINRKGIASAHILAPFDEGKEALEKQGYKIITAEENAKLRMEEGKHSFISQSCNYVGEGVLYIPNKGIFLTRNSLAMAHPKEATDSHRNNNEFYVTLTQAEKVLNDSVKITYNKSAIPTNRFKDDEITNFIFKEYAEKYGLFLKDAGINQADLCFNGKDYVNSMKKPYANQLWLLDIVDDSGISGCRYFDCNGGRVRGVRNFEEGKK